MNEFEPNVTKKLKDLLDTKLVRATDLQIECSRPVPERKVLESSHILKLDIWRERSSNFKEIRNSLLTDLQTLTDSTKSLNLEIHMLEKDSHLQSVENRKRRDILSDLKKEVSRLNRVIEHSKSTLQERVGSCSELWMRIEAVRVDSGAMSRGPSLPRERSLRCHVHASKSEERILAIREAITSTSAELSFAQKQMDRNSRIIAQLETAVAREIFVPAIVTREFTTSVCIRPPAGKPLRRSISDRDLCMVLDRRLDHQLELCVSA